MVSGGRTTPGAGGRRESIGVPSSGIGANSTSVKVVVRIRPTSGSDASNVPTRFQRTVVTPLNSTTLQVEQAGTAHAGATAASVASAAKNSGKTAFTFDRVIGPEEGQAAVYECAEPLIDSFLEGMNSTILAYGQTSSGKSYTMGTDRTSDIDDDAGPERLGITPRAVAAIFSRMNEIQQESKGGTTFSAKLSYVELHNEDLIDLLAGDADVRPMVQIREDKTGNIIWSGLREVKVTSASEVMNNLTAGSALRQTNATDMNAQSSRSHAIFSLTLTQKKYTGTGQPPSPSQSRISRPSGLPRVTSPTPGASRSATPTSDRPSSRFGLRPPSSVGRASSPQPDDPKENGTDSWVTITSKFHFVDLAGSERLKRTSAQGERVKEGISINSGLHALGNVISALGDPARARQTTHIPYRDSKLTRLLQDSLGGNAQTMMVACVSPTEYNLNETVSTVKYANRARNIKNRAEINEVEVGWDDVDYLQKTILKLRAEMTALKGGDAAAMGPIAEEGMRGGEFAELQQKYAQVTADLAKAQQAALPVSSLSREDFARAVEPIVEEYEKSLSALESQLSLTKAALGHSEEEMRDLEARVEEEVRANEASGILIGDLKSRVARLAEREATTEAYVRDLEAKLNDYGVQDEDHGSAVSDLRKEITRQREQSESTEGYIRELEGRLAQSDELSATLRRQIEVLERDVERREEAYRDLEGRLTLLDTSGEHKLLLTEIDDRDRRLLDLERNIDELKSVNLTATQEATRLGLVAQKEKEQKEELQSRVRTLERASISGPSPSKPRNGSLTPPQTPAEGTIPHSDPLMHLSSTTPAGFAALQAQIEELQHKYDKTLVDLNSANGKYLDSLKEIEDLNSQVQEAKLVSTEDGDTVPSPSSPSFTQSTSDEAEGENGTSGTTLTTPPAPARTPRSRRSMPLAPQSRLSFLGGRGVGGQGTSHLRSASLSQELSLAQGSPVFSSPPSPRAPSPTRRESRDVFSATSDRTYEQMKGEVMKLQQALNEREQEIATLEASLHQLRGSAPSTADATPLTSSPPLIVTSGVFTPTHGTPNPGQTDVSMSPRTKAAFDALRSEFNSSDQSGQEEHVVDEASSIRLDNLMRSMAKKESTHREVIEDLDDQLSTLRRQHDELTVLSRDQVVNMSSEIDRLRTQLEGRPEASHYDAQLATMQSNLDSKHAELTTLAEEHQRSLDSTTAAHSVALVQLKDEHAEVLRKSLAERDETLKQKEAEHAALLKSQSGEHAEALRLQGEDHENALRAKSEEMDGAVKRKAEELDDANRRFEIERAALVDSKDGDFASSIDQLNQEHATVLEKREGEYAAAIAKLGGDHSEALTNRDATHAGAIANLRQEHDEALSQTITSHSETLNSTREEHAAAVAALVAASAAAVVGYEAKTKEVADAHTATLETVKQQHASQVESLANTHKEELATLADQHSSSLEAAKAAHASTLQTLTDEHSTKLNELQSAHDTALATIKEEHATLLSQQQQAHEAALAEVQQQVRQSSTLLSRQSMYSLPKSPPQASDKSVADLKSRDDEHASAVAALLEQHASTVSTLNSEHSTAIDALKAEHGDALTAQVSAHSTALDELRSSHQTAFSDLQTQHADATKALTELSATHESLTTSHNTLQASAAEHATEKEALATQVRDLSGKHDELTTAHQAEITTLEASLAAAVARHQGDTADPKHEQTATELQDALDALSTLEKALLESQQERDRLLEQVQQLKGDTVAGEKTPRDSMSSDAARNSSMSPTMNGVVANGFGHHDSSERAMSPTPDGRVTPPNARLGLGVNGAGLTAGKPPPPTPPPSMPPPPLPTALPALPNGTTVGRTARSSSASSQTGLSGMMSVRNSTSMDSTSSIRTPGTSVTDSVTIDPRVAKKFEEQETQITRLTSQLTHCEADLQANIDLVNTLESALNDSERNLRKARTQMNDLARERDTFLGQNDSLRQQVQDAHSEVETVRHSVVEVESRLQREREQREQEAAMLRRMDDVDKRKKQQSKFNCF